MDEQIRKTVIIRARIKPVERDLLAAMCSREGLTTSEVVRQAIREKARAEGLYIAFGNVIKLMKGVQDAAQPK